MAQVTLNHEKNGIEIRFDGKPTEDIISGLKEHGFRWSGKQKMWYAKQSDDRMEFASGLSNDVVSGSKTTNYENDNNYDLWDLTRTDKLENNFVKYHIYDTKKIASIIRSHIRERFPMCRWSVTSDHNSIRVKLKSSPFAEQSDEVKAITYYTYRFSQSYNYDNSDPMSDYYDVNFYGVYENDIVDYDYQQTDLPEAYADVSERFHKSKEVFEIQEAEREEREFQESMRRMEKEREVSRRAQEIRDEKHRDIEAAYTVLSADYFVLNCVETDYSKLDNIVVLPDDVQYSRTNCHVSREVYLPQREYDMFIRQLLDDYSFLEGKGGTATDDLRIQSIKDYEMMSGEERKTVEWYCNDCVAIFCENELRLIINPEGYNYARYTYFVDDQSRIVQEYHGKPGISEDEYRDNLNDATTIEDVSANIIMANDLRDAWCLERFDVYSEKMKEWIYDHPDYDFRVGVVRATQIEELKTALYRILLDVTSVSEQCRHADMQTGQRITMFYLTDFGNMVTSHATFDHAEYGNYAQYPNAVKLVFRPENKRSLYYKWFHGDLVIADGWQELPENILWDVRTTEDGVTTKMSRFLSCDENQYSVILDYLKSQHIKILVNTRKK